MNSSSVPSPESVPLSRTESGWLARPLRTLDATAAFLDSHPSILITLLLLVYLPPVLVRAREHLLWHDELFTFYISQAPSLSTLLRQSRSLDLNPPLSYLLTRFCMHVLHPSNFSCRLPSMAGFLAAILCLYAFVRDRLSPVYGFVAASALIASPLIKYAWEARPYGLLLGFLGIAAFAWQRYLVNPDRLVRFFYLALLLVASLCMFFTHVLAPLSYAAILGCELVRSVQRRRIDWLLWVVLLLPLATLVRADTAAVANYQVSAIAYAYLASPQQLGSFYGAMCASTGVMLLLSMLLILAVKRDGEEGERRKGDGTLLLPGLFAAWLLVMPTVLMFLLMRRHGGFFSRYAIPAYFGFALFSALFIAWWTRRNRTAALISAVVFLFLATGTQKGLAVIVGRWMPATPASPALLSSTPPAHSLAEWMDRAGPSLPLVTNSGITFLEMDSRESTDFLKRVYYLTDHDAAMQYAHATIFEGMAEEKKEFPIRANVMPYRDFLHQHPRFLVLGTYDDSEDWVLRKLLTDGANLRMLGNIPGSVYGDPRNSFVDSTVYEVTCPKQSCQ